MLVQFVHDDNIAYEGCDGNASELSLTYHPATACYRSSLAIRQVGDMGERENECLSPDRPDKRE